MPMWCLVCVCGWVIMLCIHLFLCMRMCVTVYMHVCLAYSPIPWHELLFAPICLPPPVCCFSSPLLADTSPSPPPRVLSSRLISLSLSTMSVSTPALGSVPGTQTCKGGGCTPYANDPTLCKSAPPLIKSQLQIQLAD